MKKAVVILTALIMCVHTYAQVNYSMDKNHTRVGFSATHFGISHVEGRFKAFTASLVSAKEDFSDAAINLTADIKSIDTDIEMRDNDLRSDKWFDAEKYPTLIFKSTSFKKENGKNYKLDGLITIHGITKPISFTVIYNGKGLNPMSKKNSVGFTITGKLNRDDFKVGTGGGNGVVSNEVELIANAEFIID